MFTDLQVRFIAQKLEIRCGDAAAHVMEETNENATCAQLRDASDYVAFEYVRDHYPQIEHDGRVALVNRIMHAIFPD